MNFPIFTASYLKKYSHYKNETFRNYRGVECLYVTQISDLYLFFCQIHDLKVGVQALNITDSNDFFPFLRLHRSKSIYDIMKKLSETTEGLNVSVYLKFQTSLYFFLCQIQNLKVEVSELNTTIQIIFPIFTAS